MADRFAIVLMQIDATHGTIKPFTSDEFWWSKAAWELRAMPGYQENRQAIREMIG